MTRMGATLRRAGHHGQARNTFSSFLFRVLPFPASRPMSSGHFMCMALSPTKDTRREVWMQALAYRSKVWRASLGDFGSPNCHSAEPSRSPWAALGDLGGPSGQRGGARGSTELNGGARQTLRTVQSGGHVCPRSWEALYILNMEEITENWSGNAPRKTLRTMHFCAHIPHDGRRVATSRLLFF